MYNKLICKKTMKVTARTSSCTFKISYVYLLINDRLCGLVVRVPGYRTEMYCIPVRYELNLYMLCRRK
jgi:hypothetical protein